LLSEADGHVDRSITHVIDTAMSIKEIYSLTVSRIALEVLSSGRGGAIRHRTPRDRRVA
jgi:hypothetical protein